jgi:hypothetical protein
LRNDLVGYLAFVEQPLSRGQFDWFSAMPLAMTAALLLTSPKFAVKLARDGFRAHLLDLGSIRMIESEESPVA